MKTHKVYFEDKGLIPYKECWDCQHPESPKGGHASVNAVLPSVFSVVK